MILTGTGIIEDRVTFGPEFIVGGVSSLMQYSFNGTTYNSATTTGSYGIRDIAFSREQNKIVCIIPGNTGLYSTNNTSYSTFSNASSATWFMGNWGAELGIYVMLAVEGYAGTNAAASSPDGITWTLRSVPNANAWRDSDYSPDRKLFVAVSSDGTNRAIWSDNGTSWNAGTIENRIWAGCCWAQGLGLFSAVSATDGKVAISSDGKSWTVYNAPNTSEWTSVVWAPKLDLLIAVSANGSTSSVMTSPDGITWTVRTTPSYYGWEMVTWSESIGLAVAVGTQGTNQSIMTSPDGINWSSVTTTTTTLLSVTATD